MSRIAYLALLGLNLLASAPQAAEADLEQVVGLLDLVIDSDVETARRCLRIVTTSVQDGSLGKDRAQALQEQLSERLAPIVRDQSHALQFDALQLTAALGDRESLNQAGRWFNDASQPLEQRLICLQTLIAAGASRQVLSAVSDAINDPRADAAFRMGVIESLGRVKDDETGREIALLLVDNYPEWEPDVRPKAIEVLTQRPSWTGLLLAAVVAKEIDKDDINLNQLRRVATFKDEAIRKTLKELYGEIREGRDPNREQVFYKTRDFLNGTPGDPFKGEAVFKKVCGQCHKLYGEGAEVGPDITRNGRNNWDQLLWNLLDPSQVIGPGYQARILVTTDGRTLTGLPVEESEQRVVLKVQGGKQESIPRDQIEIYKVSELSMMPDQLEKQLTPQELADVLSFLAHDRHPKDPEAKLLPGAPSPRR